MDRRPELVIASGPMAGRRFEVGPGGTRLGRSSTNDVYIPDEGLSRNHCLFEQSGSGGIRVTDLASANGTYVNREALGADSRELRPGDRIEVGTTVIDVVGADAPDAGKSAAPGGGIDLGLGTARKKLSVPGLPSKDGSARRPALANILWIAAAAAMVAAIAVVLFVPRGTEDPGGVEAKPGAAEREKADARLMSLYYEKVEADSSRIFRYQMTIDDSGTLRVAYDDVPGENRHVDKKGKLSEAAAKRIVEILDKPGFSSLDDEYTGQSVADENALRSYRIRIVRRNGVRDILVENTQEPDVFRDVREALEAFSRNELGIWAIQYSREQLLEKSEQSISVGDSKWEERDVEFGNLSASSKAYRDAVFYLETINPKPAWYAELKEKLARTDAELKRRYGDQRFRADKAINLGEWDEAQRELKILCELVPEKTDPRHAEANAKLVDVENRMKKKGRSGR